MSKFVLVFYVVFSFNFNTNLSLGVDYLKSGKRILILIDELMRINIFRAIFLSNKIILGRFIKSSIF